jgi:tetratricopeptide (TPR) repeat protein
MAWRLVTGHPLYRDNETALDWATKAVELEPAATFHWNTLGLAQYRAGRYAEAIVTLEKSLAANAGTADAFDLFFLAMARARLGQVAEARRDFERARAWHREHPQLPQSEWHSQLDQFEAEARALLDGPSVELPEDLFAPRPSEERSSH